MNSDNLNTRQISRLQKKVEKLEKRIKALVLKDSSMSVRASVAELCENRPKDAQKLDDLLLSRCYILNDLFRGTADEIERLSKVNEHLGSESIRLDEMVDDVCLAMNNLGKDWVNDLLYEFELHPCVPFEYPVYACDEYYHSDFNSIINIECAFCLVYDGRIHSVAETVYYSGEKVVSATDMDEEFDDWVEGHWRDDIKGIKWCHSLHQLEDHMDFPLIDIIQLKKFEVSFRLSN